MPNKGNIEPQKMERYLISTAKITEYLQQQLGFPIAVDYTRWTGVSNNFSYVRMRVGIRNTDILASTQPSPDYVTRLLNQNSQALPIRENVQKILKKYMYDWERDIKAIQDPAQLQRAYTYGLTEDRLKEVMMFSNLTLVKEQGMWRVYLKPGEIIRDMLADPDTGKVDGKPLITGVFGRESETIRFEVEVYHDFVSDANGDIGAVSMDRLFMPSRN